MGDIVTARVQALKYKKEPHVIRVINGKVYAEETRTGKRYYVGSKGRYLRSRSLSRKRRERELERLEKRGEISKVPEPSKEEVSTSPKPSPQETQPLKSGFAGRLLYANGRNVYRDGVTPDIYGVDVDVSPQEKARERAFEQRVTESQERQKKFFESEGFQRVQRVANIMTTRGTLKLTKKGFKIDTSKVKPFEERSWAGKTGQLIVGGTMASPIGLGGSLPMVGEKLSATGEGLVASRRTRKNVFKEYKRSFDKKEFKETFDITKPKGAATYTSAAVSAGLIAGTKLYMKQQPTTSKTTSTSKATAKVIAKEKPIKVTKEVRTPWGEKVTAKQTFQDIVGKGKVYRIYKGIKVGKGKPYVYKGESEITKFPSESGFYKTRGDIVTKSSQKVRVTSGKITRVSKIKTVPTKSAGIYEPVTTEGGSSFTTSVGVVKTGGVKAGVEVSFGRTKPFLQTPTGDIYLTKTTGAVRTPTTLTKVSSQGLYLKPQLKGVLAEKGGSVPRIVQTPKPTTTPSFTPSKFNIGTQVATELKGTVPQTISPYPAFQGTSPFIPYYQTQIKKSDLKLSTDSTSKVTPKPVDLTLPEDTDLVIDTGKPVVVSKGRSRGKTLQIGLPTQTQIQQPTQITTPITTPDLKQKQIIQPKTPPFQLPTFEYAPSYPVGFSFPAPFLPDGGGGRRFKIKTPKYQPKQYIPTAYAQFAKITAKKLTPKIKIGELTGLGVRPIITKKKKKRRKK